MRGRVARAMLAATLTTLAVSFVQTSALAEPTAAELAQARDLFAKAEKDERGGDWNGALEKMTRAGAVKMTPGIQFHIALCHENLGHLVEALASYEAAAQQARAENVRDVLDAVQEPLADLRARVPALTLSLTNASPEGVTISIGQRPVHESELGAPIRLMPGTHHIVAKRHSDGRSFNKEILLRERDTVALDLRLPPVESEKAWRSRERPRSDRPPEKSSRVGAVVATGGAVVLVGGAIGAFLIAGSEQNDREKRCRTSPDCGDEGVSAIRTWDAIALTGFIAGAGVAALATVLWLTPNEPRSSSTKPRLGFGASGRGVTLGGTF